MPTETNTASEIKNNSETETHFKTNLTDQENENSWIFAGIVVDSLGNQIQGVKIEFSNA